MSNWQKDPSQLFSVVSGLANEANSRIYQTAALLRMYEPTMVLNTPLAQLFQTPITYATDAPRLNIYSQIIRHAHNYFARSFPKAVFLPVGANKTTRDQAESLTQFVDGCFLAGDLQTHARRALLHAVISGTGIIKVIDTGETPTYEWVLPTEIFCLDGETLYGSPQSLYQRKQISREMAKGLWPEVAGKLTFENPANGDMVTVIEAWSLPQGKTKGRHAIVLEPNLVVLDEKYKQKRFPFAVYRFIEPAIGYWGIGLGQILSPYQIQINRILKNIEANIHLGGNLKLLIDTASGVSGKHITNDLRGNIVQYTGNPPKYLTQPLVSPDILQHLDMIISQMWKASRFGENQGVGALPPGINSRVAMLTASDIMAENHSTTGKQWEEFFLDLAELTIDAAKRISEREGDVKVVWKNSNALEQRSLKECLDKDLDYRIEVRASSRIRDSVAGRMELADWLAQSGIWGPQDILEAIDLPSVFGDIELDLAPSKNIDAYLDAIARGEPKAPHPKLDLQLAKTKAMKFINHLEHTGADEESITRVSEWIDEIDRLLAASEPPPEEMPPQQQG